MDTPPMDTLPGQTPLWTDNPPGQTPLSQAAPTPLGGHLPRQTPPGRHPLPRQTSPIQTLLQRTVHILLECILVFKTELERLWPRCVTPTSHLRHNQRDYRSHNWESVMDWSLLNWFWCVTTAAYYWWSMKDESYCTEGNQADKHTNMMRQCWQALCS